MFVCLWFRLRRARSILMHLRFLPASSSPSPRRWLSVLRLLRRRRHLRKNHFAGNFMMLPRPPVTDRAHLTTPMPPLFQWCRWSSNVCRPRVVRSRARRFAVTGNRRLTVDTPCPIDLRCPVFASPFALPASMELGRRIRGWLATPVLARRRSSWPMRRR